MSQKKSPYKLILIDVPWHYRDASNAGKRGAKHKYPVLRDADVRALPVGDLAAANCLLAMWWVGPKGDEALACMRAWGFELHNMLGFVWVKRSKRRWARMQQLRAVLNYERDWLLRTKAADELARLTVPTQWATGMGRLTRSNAECVLLAKRGRVIAAHHDVKSIIEAPRLAHSAKPPETRDRLVRLVGNVPRIELFARERVRDWDASGLDIDGRDIRNSLPRLIKRIN